MKKLVLLTLTALMINSVPAMEPIPAQEVGLPKPTIGKIRTAIKNELARPVRIPQKVKFLRSNPHRLTAIRFGHVNPVDAPDDEYILNTQARRLTVVHGEADEDISANVRVRLAVARAKALQKYREVWA